MSLFFKLSKSIHKYIGLVLILFLMWMSLSGILLNHPELIATVSVPHWLVPSQYKVENWNRSSLIQLLYSQKNPEIAYAGGKQGVWKTADGGRTFTPLTNGFPASRYYRKTNTILLWEQGQDLLLAGTNGGLYACAPQMEKWRKIPLHEEIEAVKKIIAVKNSLVVFTDSRAYTSPLPPAKKMVTGYFKTPAGEEFITTHEQGLLPVGNAKKNGRFIMPPEMEAYSEVPLWNYLFEIHNGRFFKDLIGNWYILDVPVGSMLFVLITLSGIYDWLYLKVLRKTG